MPPSADASQYPVAALTGGMGVGVGVGTGVGAGAGTVQVDVNPDPKPTAENVPVAVAVPGTVKLRLTFPWASAVTLPSGTMPSVKATLSPFR